MGNRPAETVSAYTDSRCSQIEANLGRAVATYADRNLAGWVLDMLADDRIDDEAGSLRVCDRFACKHPHILSLVGAAAKHGRASFDEGARS